MCCCNLAKLRYSLAKVISVWFALLQELFKMAQKARKKRLFRGMPYNDYLVVWRAIRKGEIASWEEAETLGLCKPQGQKGRPAKRLDEMIRAAKAKQAEQTAAV